MKKILALVLLLCSLSFAQTAKDSHEWGNNSGRWWTHKDTTYYHGSPDTTYIGGESFYTWPFVSLFITLDDTVAVHDSEDSTNCSVYIFQSPTNDVTTSVFVDSLTFRGSGATAYTTITAAGTYGASLDTPFLECRYLWFGIHTWGDSRKLLNNRCISTWTGWNGTSSIISTY